MPHGIAPFYVIMSKDIYTVSGNLPFWYSYFKMRYK